MKEKFKFSLCVPVHNRFEDFVDSFPGWLDALESCVPSELIVIDYNSTDGLQQYMYAMDGQLNIAPGNRLIYKRYLERDYYHMAHARNLAIRESAGEFIVILSADIYPTPGMLPLMENLFEYPLPDFHFVEGFNGVIIIRRQELIDAGGYDERFEFYGPEDRELFERLTRRGLQAGRISPEYLRVKPTPDSKKISGYRLPLSKREMNKRMRVIREENNRNQILVANPEGWGKWTR